MYTSPLMFKSTSLSPKARPNTSKPRDIKRNLSPENGVDNKVKLLSSLINPNIIPAPKIIKFFDKPRPQTTRATTNTSIDNSLNKSKNRFTAADLDLSTSEETAKKIVQANAEQKDLEYQYQLMQNRIRHLQEEEQKIKSRTIETKKKTEQLAQIKERHSKELELNAQLQAAKAKMIEENKKKTALAKLKSQESSKKLDQILKERAKKAEEVKKEKIAHQNMIEEAKKKEEVKKSEKIWKVAKQEKRVEIKKVHHQQEKQVATKKRYQDKLIEKQAKVEEMSEKIKALEAIEMRLLENLKRTQANHENAFQEMQKVYASKERPTSPPKNNS